MSRLIYLILIILISSCKKQPITVGTWTSVDKIAPYKAILTISSDSLMTYEKYMYLFKNKLVYLGVASNLKRSAK